jgi:Ni/Fe-hydrogenase subunit HybB-like protein/mono/diheme cytochrome c family protein
MESVNPYKSAEPGKIDRISSDLLRTVRLNRSFLMWMAFLFGALAICLYGYTIQLREGLGVTGLRDITTWGMYIANFVFFVASSLIGMLISSVLGLIGIKWIKPIARIAEIIAVAFAAVAGLVIISDMGRPDRLPNVFLYGRLQSPILWDVTVVTVYFLVSLLLWFLPMIPDLAVARGRMEHAPKWLRQAYEILSFKWAHTDEQYKILFRMIRVLLILIVPLAFAIHTVTSWLFAVTVRPGWDSTIFGPYFISGAFVAGSAAVIIAMFFYRNNFKLKNYLTDMHFDKMGQLLGLVAIVYFYFNLNEFLIPGYKLKQLDALHIHNLFSGDHALLFWATQLLGLVIPIFLVFFKKMRKPLPLTIIAAFVMAGAWLKRYIIVVPTQEHPFLPVQNYPGEWMVYKPTLIETGVTIASFLLVLIIITTLSKLFPVIPIVEHLEEEEEDKAEKAVKKARGSKNLVILAILMTIPAVGFSQDWVVPAEKKVRLAETSFTDETVKLGSALYLINCKSCHGDPGKNNVTKLNPLPPDPVSPKMQQNLDGELYYKIQEGRGPMPGFKSSLTSAEIWEIIAYMRSFNKDYVQQIAPKTTGTNLKYSQIQMDISVLNDSAIQVAATGIENGIRVPVPGVDIQLFAHRYFGHLKLDDDQTTDPTGRARFIKHQGLPGDTSGMVRLHARFSDEDQFGAVEEDTVLAAGVPVHPVSLTAKRSMWNTVGMAPVWLLIAYPVGLLTVLSVIMYILLQLRAIFYLGKKEENDSAADPGREKS